jgi:hypothetical protein
LESVKKIINVVHVCHQSWCVIGDDVFEALSIAHACLMSFEPFVVGEAVLKDSLELLSNTELVMNILRALI